MTLSTLSGENFYTPRNSLLEVCREYLERDPQTDAFLIQYPHGIILEQSKRRFFYRGEKQIYPRSESSLKRKLRQFNNIKDQELYRLVADMRLFEFSRFIDQFQSVREWNRCDVLYELLGQHYGLETNWLDVTNDFSTALFLQIAFGIKIAGVRFRIGTSSEMSVPNGALFIERALRVLGWTNACAWESTFIACMSRVRY